MELALKAVGRTDSLHSDHIRIWELIWDVTLIRWGSPEAATRHSSVKDPCPALIGITETTMGSLKLDSAWGEWLPACWNSGMKGFRVNHSQRPVPQVLCRATTVYVLLGSNPEAEAEAGGLPRDPGQLRLYSSLLRDSTTHQSHSPSSCT